MSDNPYLYENEITWSLPCLFQYEAVLGTIQHFLKMLGFAPIKAELYGAPSCAWAGGRKPAIYDKLNPKMLGNLFEYVRKVNATPVFTFTYTGITQEDLKDEYCNMLLDTALEHNCKFMVYSDLLKDYIKNKKSDAYVISSVLKPVFYFQGANRIEDVDVEKETQLYEKLLKEYDMVALRAEYSKFILSQDTTLLKDLSRTQVLINQSCLCNCNLAPEHVKFNERFRLEKENNLEFVCPKLNLPTNVKYQNNSMHTVNEIQNLINAGVKNFKIKGRGGSSDPLHILQILVSLIFKCEGPNYLFPTGVSRDHLENEIGYFNKLLNL